MKLKRIVMLIAILSLILMLTACGSDEEEATTSQEEPQPDKVIKPKEEKRSKIDYLQRVNRLDEKVREELIKIESKREAPNLSAAITKVKKTEEYQFKWVYNRYEMQVPLYGAQGELLSDYRSEIIERFNEEFEIVDSRWTNDKEQQLVLKLGFRAEGEVDLITHRLFFSQPKPQAKLAIIIDDFGFNRRGTEEMLDIERPLTAAVLPFRPYAKEDARLAKEAGLEVILHQPLEPLDEEADPGAGAIYTDMSEQEIKETFVKNLTSLPQVSGVNHHMGSKGSTDQQMMQELLDLIKARDLYYIDSSTSQDSVGVNLAREKDIPTKENYLFIDNVDQKEEIKEMILQLSEVALDRGELLIIGHVKENTAQAIQETIPKLEEKGIKLIYASQMAK
ncbi:MAG: divergent polysaccharide deacetylase family protein [Halanaerobacter sp.]